MANTNEDDVAAPPPPIAYDRDPAAKEPEVDAVELAYWEAVKDSDDPEMFRTYLERYPDGAFAPLAKVWLGELGSPSAP